MATTAHSSTKETHFYKKPLCDPADKGGAQPIPTKPEPQIAAGSNCAFRRLRTLEERLPLLQLTAEQIGLGTKEPVSPIMAGTNDALANSMSGHLGVTRKAAQASVGATKFIVNHIPNTAEESRMGQKAAGGTKVLHERSEKLVDRYLPITTLELAELATNLKEGDVVPVQPQEYLVRLGALSAKPRHRACQHSLRKLKATRQSVYNSLSQLQQALDLIKHVKQDVGKKLLENQEKLRLLCLEWSKMNPEAKNVAHPEVEAQTLTMFHKICQQLQAACQTLASIIQGFPHGLQDKMQQVHQSIGELRSSFSTIGSFRELSSSLLSQSQEKVLKVQGNMDDVLDYVVHNAPLSWLVGPFLLSGRLPTEVADAAQ
ncbi:perilipin-3-like [Paroedura picta]|uniref:perilipin-3-like n=1 Tax=Paroedura picta TaxID=143630 RepID=UPI0040578E34